MDFILYETSGVKPRSQRSVSAPVPPTESTIQTTMNSAVDGHCSPLPPSDGSEADVSSQGETPLTSPGMSRGEPFDWNADECNYLAIPLNNYSVAEDDKGTEQAHGPQATCSPVYGSGQHFKSAHQYAELAHAAAQVELRSVMSSLENESCIYLTGQPCYYPLVRSTLGSQRRHIHARAYGNLSGIPEHETGNGWGWTSSTWNVSLYREPAVEVYYSSD